ncbi:glycoside hydrolase family 16 protein [Moniliophthora roreri MCA 2997]|uniref:Glycoside hydrolase family 16 protein n=1 Tax=Moniliophthora roreri (strain MCA 2997) TaxID=1381753 RepID=V2XDP8_MONRO|nr:glycoside hydrolase family 16 protein [Moniliophthora roreri MCA 2997]
MRLSMSQLLAITIWVLQLRTAIGQHRLVQEYSGSDFFSKWEYDGGVARGNAQFVDENTAIQQKLTFVESSTGHAIVRVDNTTSVGAGSFARRNSVRITSKDAYPIGSLIIMDVIHMPYGCSVLPSFRTSGNSITRPHAGEIAIIETEDGISMNPNYMALYTDAGCIQSSYAVQSGSTVERNCSPDLGCRVEQTDPESSGSELAEAGGGIFAAQIDPAGIFIWFWSRGTAPASISKSKAIVDISDWGQASASYLNDTCEVKKHFGPQKLVLDINICAHWAGTSFESLCPGDCNAYVTGDGKNYTNAYWEISYIRVFIDKQSSTVLTTEGAEETASGLATLDTFDVFRPTDSDTGSSTSNSNTPSLVYSTLDGNDITPTACTPLQVPTDSDSQPRPTSSAIKHSLNITLLAILGSIVAVFM